MTSKNKEPTGSARSLVDTEHGVVSRAVFVDNDIYEQELERLFTRAWLFIGHDSQLQKPGDYFLSRMGEESVVCALDRAGAIHVFLNSCRHRGMKVCRYDEGNTPIFTCPYHGWSYGLDGRLAGVPHFQDAYNEKLDKSQWGLVEARVAIYKGTLWACWDPDAPIFEDYLGDMHRYLDAVLMDTGGDELGAESIGGIQKWIVPCNWKLVAENFAGDHYHTVSHTSVELVGIGPGGRGQTRHGNGRSFRVSETSFPALGHGFRGSPIQEVGQDVYPFPTFDDPGVQAYFEKQYLRLKESPNWPPAWLFGGGGTIFPSMSFHIGFPRSIVVAHPAGPHSTEMWRWYLVDAGAPPKIKQFLRDYMLRYSGPAGMTEQDDMENWNLATTASSGTIAKRHPYNYQIGIGATHSGEKDGLEGALISDGSITEQNALTLYRRWAEYLDS